MEIPENKRPPDDTPPTSTPNRNWGIKFLIKFKRKLGILASLCFCLWIFFSLLAIADYQTLKSIEFSSTLLGIIGVLVGLITVGYVEGNNDARTQENKVLLENIQTATNEIHGKLYALEFLNQTSERFLAIKKVIDQSKETGNELYMVSYGVKYGQFLLANLNVIEDHKSITVSKDYLYAEELLSNSEDLRKLCENIDTGLKELADKEKLNIACLKREKYKSFVRSRVLKNKTVILPKDSQKMYMVESPTKQYGNRIDLGPQSEWNDVFVHQSDEQGDSNEDRIEILIDAVTSKDFSLRHRLFENTLNNDSSSRIRLHEMEYIPFQFFLRVPPMNEKKQRKASDWYAVVVYTDYNNIGKKRSVVSFTTCHPDFCGSLLETYDELVASHQRPKYKTNALLKNCFYSSSEINIVNNVMLAQDSSGASLDALALADITAKEYLIRTLRDLDQQFTFDSLFIKQGTTINPNQLLKTTSFCIGLFDNEFTSHLAGLFPNERTSLTGKYSFFKLIAVDKTLSPNSENKLEILCEGSNHTVPDIYTEGVTYAILSRMIYRKKCAFVFGGLDAIATSKLKPCLDELNECLAQHSEKNEILIDNVTPYIVLFTINLTNEATKSISIELITTLNEKSELKTIRNPGTK